MLGLALEGGGAKGAYHLGVVKALLEEGYQFDGVTGTSIGAINAAVIAQGSFAAGYACWEKMDFDTIFDMDREEYDKLINRNLDKAAVSKLVHKARSLVLNRGISTQKIRDLINSVLDEDKLRASPVDFGLVTVSISDLKPLELYKEDIPLGRMTDYLIASASLPGFELKRIENKYFLDGGFYDNCPMNLLAGKGYKEIIAIRTLAMGIVQPLKDTDIHVTNIIPNESLGPVLNFNNASIRKNLRLGYLDGKRHIHGLCGSKYYLDCQSFSEEDAFKIMTALPDKVIHQLGSILGIPAMLPKRMLFEQIIPQLAVLADLAEPVTYLQIIIKMCEIMAGEIGVEKYRIYNLQEFFKVIKNATPNPAGVFEEDSTRLPLFKQRQYKIRKAAGTIYQAMFAAAD